jgi:hypothetical protein
MREQMNKMNSKVKFLYNEQIFSHESTPLAQDLNDENRDRIKRHLTRRFDEIESETDKNERDPALAL